MAYLGADVDDRERDSAAQQVVAHREARLSATDHQDFVLVIALSCHGPSGSSFRS
jgi:hypothetical protein